MKKLLCILFLAGFIQTKAQYVTIPDAKFVAWLQTNIPSAMSGNQMDTTNAIVTTYTAMNVAGDSISDLTGIQYFDSLKVLDCSNGTIPVGINYLTTLPTLPATLDTLICNNNQLTSLPTLPTTLIDLECRYNQLTSLPAIPNSLLTLSCVSNKLTSLPVLPNTLTSLDFGYNLFTTLGTLPDSLITLGCYENQLSSLPALPVNLTGLSCEGNLLTKLPAFPNNLWYLDCNFNQIDTLPNIPATLVFLLAGYNNLTYIPALPYGLKVFECHENYITSLPPLPSTLTTFLCYNNQITCFDFISSAISTLQIHDNPFTCLPNYTTAMDSLTLTYPLCAAGNANGCPLSCAPTLSLSLNKYTICKGDSQLLSVSGADSYIWSPAGTLNDFTSATPYAKPNATTVYSVVGTGTNTICGNSAPVTVTITINTIQVNSPIICVGNTATLTASGVNTYTWSTGDTTATITASPTVTTNYIVTGTDSINCIISDTTAITINPPINLAPPVLSNFVNPITICQGAGLIINVTPDSASVPVWYISNNIINQGNSYTPSTSVTDTIVYTVIDSLAIAGCASVVSSPLTFSLIINQAPTPPHIAESSAVYCQGAALPVLHATGSDAIEWLINGIPTYVGNTYTITSPPVGTTYYFALDSSTTNGCFNAHADSIYITILPDSLPTVSFQLISDSVPHVFSIDAYYSANVISAHWYWGDGKDTISINPVHTYDSAGVYNICVTAYNACGDSVYSCQSDSVFRTAGTQIISVHVIEVTGVSTVAAQSSVIKIYPNPAQNNFTIETNSIQKQTLQVFDINGKLVLSQNINSTTTIDASNFNAGVYNLSIISGTGLLNKRLIIVK